MTDAPDTNWYSNDAATFGDRVAAAREARQMSQALLAKRLGVEQESIEAWENDLAEPEANKLQMLSGVLSVTIPWLLGGEGDGVSLGPDESAMPDIAAIMSEIRDLRTDMRRSAERLAVIEKRLKGALLREPEAVE